VRLAVFVAIVYVLHQDWWFWNSTAPLVFGFIPIGLFYHAVYTIGIAGFMWFLARAAWPAHLERDGQ
jgi:hypothetical protein